MKNWPRSIHKYFFILFILLISLGNLQRIVLANNFVFYLHDLVIAAWLLFIIIIFKKTYIKFLKNKLKNIYKNKYLKLFLIWILISWILALINHAGLLKAILYSLRIIYYLLFAANLQFLIAQKYLKAKFIKIGFLTFGLIILYFGLLQYLFLPDTRFLAALNWDDHYYRLISTLLDPNFTGIILIIIFFLLQSIKVNKYFKDFLSLVILAGLLLTYSRASYLAFIISLAFFIFLKFAQKQLLLKNILFLILFLILIPVLPKHGGEGTKLLRTASITARTSSITTSLGSLKKIDLIFGQGLFTRANQINNNSHAYLETNSFIQILIGTGIPGLLLFLLALGNFIKNLYKQKKFCLLAGLLAILIHSFFNATLTYPFIVIMLGGVLASKTKA